jgi:hypothetical protein
MRIAMRKGTIRRPLIAALVLLSAVRADAQTADDVMKRLEHVADLNTIDLCTFDVKYRPGLQPSLAAFDADESGMTVLKNPHEALQRMTPAAAGWYRVSFVVPERLGKFKSGDNLAIEINVQGSWELLVYLNGKPAAVEGPTARYQQPAAHVTKNVVKGSKPGDRITCVILATSYPWGGGSPDGFALRHLRLGRRLAGPYEGFALDMFSLRDKLARLQGEPLKELQERVKGPLARMDALDAAAETGNGGTFLQAIEKASRELNEALRKK